MDPNFKRVKTRRIEIPAQATVAMLGPEAQYSLLGLADFQARGPASSERWLRVDSPAEDQVYILESMQVQESTILDLYRQ